MCASCSSLSPQLVVMRAQGQQETWELIADKVRLSWRRLSDAMKIGPQAAIVVRSEHELYDRVVRSLCFGPFPHTEQRPGLQSDGGHGARHDGPIGARSLQRVRSTRRWPQRRQPHLLHPPSHVIDHQHSLFLARSHTQSNALAEAGRRD